MKKLFTSFALLAISHAGFAQLFHFGLKAEPGIYWYSTDATATDNNGANFGFAYGAIAEFGFTENYAFATGLDISQFSGSYIKTLNKDTSVTLNTSLQYLKIPLTIKMKTNEIGPFRYFGQFGVSLGFNLSGSYTGSVDRSGVNISNINKTKFNSTGSMETSLFRPALLIGIGLEYSLSGSTSLLVGVYYDNGFLNVLGDKKLNLSIPGVSSNQEAPDLLSKGLALTVGILF